ncbi:MAG TPA: GDYXXLXY domain-containing protein, partial [Symbiobacteriaceae bacterium]|nr:GDYXXLXY domain-containing protein [Symbiobacteriaceae bacterium]
WVTLSQGSPYWKVTHVSDFRPASVAADQVVLRGTVEWVDDGNWPGSRHVVMVRYGIEQFYVPESETGLDQHRGEFTVQVRVDRFGRAALEKVFLGDKELKWR